MEFRVPFKIVDALMTNFHQPRTTLLMLVSAFVGIEPIRRAYEEAVSERYRFYSYGDAMLILTCPSVLCRLLEGRSYGRRSS